MKEHTNHIEDQLLLRYLLKDVSDVEVDQVESWLAFSSENREYYGKFCHVWERAESIADFDRIDLQQNWRAVQAKINKNKRSSLAPYWRVAAAVLVLATTFFLIDYLSTSTPAAQFSFTEQVMNASAQVLPDGSNVWLKKNSHIEYQDNNSNRQVILTGEAYFDVTRDPEKPFVIEANNTRTEVLGTSFNLNTGNDNKGVELVLVSGKVQFSTTNETVVLAPGQRVLVDANGFLTKTSNTNRNFLAWRTQTFVFENTPMSEVLSDIGNAYGEQFRFDTDSFKGCSLTSRYEKQSLEDILNTLEALFGARFDKSGDTYFVKGGSCKQ